MTFSCGHATSLLSNTEGLYMIVVGRHEAVLKVYKYKGRVQKKLLKYGLQPSRGGEEGGH